MPRALPLAGRLTTAGHEPTEGMDRLGAKISDKEKIRYRWIDDFNRDRNMACFVREACGCLVGEMVIIWYMRDRTISDLKHLN
ncbi:hypothetical protein CTheo_9263 [Ceratobasidium theobromae]|uniref:Uncharacterized protein n=1 Tax=Ceratobasidium theobromae TaxID=1582974 RepID=A0A5N5Q3F8_9AGAM|nr:hypothetical protein CTheo_9263 [Ceratobasidium theobromae]